MEKMHFTFAPVMEAPKDGGIPRRFSGVAYSGGVIPGYLKSGGDAIIDTDSLTIPPRPIFALVDHDPRQRAGRMTARIEAGRVLVEGQFFDTPTGREVAQLFSEGAPWEMSVGIDAKLEPVEGDINANGQNFSSVRGAFRNGVLREVSFVPMGADPHTGVVAFAKPTQDNQPPTEGQKMTEIDELKQRLAESEAKASALESMLNEIKLAKRREGIAALEAATGIQMDEGKRANFERMSDSDFETVSATFSTLAKKPALPASMTQELAKEGKTDETDSAQERMNVLCAAIVQQITGGK